MVYNCPDCQSEYVDAEQAQMIVRPEGIPPFKINHPWQDGGTYQWDFISRYIKRFRIQTKDQGYRSQMLQHLAAETASWSRPPTCRAEPGSERSVESDFAETGSLPAPASGRGSQGAEPVAAPASVAFAAPASKPWDWHSGERAFAAPASGSGSQGAEPFAAPAVPPQDAVVGAVATAIGALGFSRQLDGTPSAQTSTLPSPGPPPSYPPPGRSAAWFAHKQSQMWVPDAQLQGAEPLAAPAAGRSGSGSREVPESQQPAARKRMQCGVGLIGTDKWNYWSESYSESPSPVTQPGLEMTPAEWKENLDYLKLEWCRENCRAALGVHVASGDAGGDLNCPHCRRHSPYHAHYSSGSSGSCESPQSQQQPRAPAADADGTPGSSSIVDLLDQADSEDDAALLQACRQAEAQSQSPPSIVPPTTSPPSFLMPPVLPPSCHPAGPVPPLSAGATEPLSAKR